LLGDPDDPNTYVPDTIPAQGPRAGDSPTTNTLPSSPARAPHSCLRCEIHKRVVCDDEEDGPLGVATLGAVFELEVEPAGLPPLTDRVPVYVRPDGALSLSPAGGSFVRVGWLERASWTYYASRGKLKGRVTFFAHTRLGASPASPATAPSASSSGRNASPPSETGAAAGQTNDVDEALKRQGLPPRPKKAERAPRLTEHDIRARLGTSSNAKRWAREIVRNVADRPSRSAARVAPAVIRLACQLHGLDARPFGVSTWSSLESWLRSLPALESAQDRQLGKDT
jgi:hypothetical protein